MSAIQRIKQGIELGSWDDICLAYEELTGETLSPPSSAQPSNELHDELAALAAKMGMSLSPTNTTVTTAPSAKPKGRPAKVAKSALKKKELSKADILRLEREAVEKYSVEEIAKEGWRSGRGPVSAKGRKPIFIGGELENEHLKAEAESHKSGAKARPSYKEKIVKCTQCSSEFNYAKSYPAGQLKESFECLCPNCLANKQR